MLTGQNAGNGPPDRRQVRYGWLTRLAAANEPVRAGVTKLRNVSRCWLGYAGDAAGDVLHSHFDAYINCSPCHLRCDR